MKVALIDPFKRGHHRSYSSILSEGLLEKGIETVYMGNKEIADYLNEKGIQTHPLNLWDHKNPIIREGAKFAFVKQALSLSRGNVDIVHFLYADRFIRSLGFFSNPENDPPLCATIHWGYLLPEFYTGRKLDRIKCSSENMALGKIVRNGSRIMVHSEILSRRFAQCNGTDSFDPVPYPIEIDPHDTFDSEGFRKQMDIPQNCILLLCFGEARYEKGFDLAIRSLPHLPQYFHLAICGPEKDLTKDDLFNLGQKIGVSPRLHLNLRYVSESEMISWFMASDLLLIPYRTPFSGQSGPLINAANLGLPVIVSDLAVLRETVEKYTLGKIFEEGNLNSLVNTTLAISKDLSKVRNLTFTKDHSPEKFVDSVIRSYLRTLSPKEGQ